MDIYGHIAYVHGHIPFRTVWGPKLGGKGCRLDDKHSQMRCVICWVAFLDSIVAGHSPRKSVRSRRGPELNCWLYLYGVSASAVFTFHCGLRFANRVNALCGIQSLINHMIMRGSMMGSVIISMIRARPHKKSMFGFGGSHRPSTCCQRHSERIQLLGHPASLEYDQCEVTFRTGLSGSEVKLLIAIIWRLYSLSDKAL